MHAHSNTEDINVCYNRRHEQLITKKIMDSYTKRGILNKNTLCSISNFNEGSNQLKWGHVT